MSAIQLVLLDFDGTLVDTATDLVRATNLFLRSRGVQELPDATIRNQIGYGMKNLILKTFPPSQHDPSHWPEMERDFLKIYESEYLKTPEPFPGAIEFLESWKGQLAIVSNKRLRHILAILTHLKLDRFPWTSIIGGDSFPQMKPHPQPFLEAMKKAGTERAETVMVGDGVPDIEGAAAVGIRSIAVSFGYSPIAELVRLGATSTIASYAELNTKLGAL
jgi:phosphoglycolate phosphatase